MTQNEKILNKNEFFGKIKEIDDLDYLDIESQELLNNLVFNNIFINENKNIYLNDINPKNNNNMKISSEKKEINNYNRINFKNKNFNNIMSKQKNMNTDKKGNLRYSKKLSEKLVSNNLSDNKNNNNNYNLEKNNFVSFENKEGLKTQNLYNFDHKYNNLSINNNYKTYTKFEENNNIIKLKNLNNNKYSKKFSDKLNISPTQKRFSTLTNNKKDETIDAKPDNVNDNEDIYEQLINQKKINNNLMKKLEFLNKEILRKNNIIKKLSFQNDKYKNIIQKMKVDNEYKQKVNKDLSTKLNSYKNEIILLKNREKYNLDSNNLLKNKYMNEINKSKEKMRKYEHENNNLKILLKKSKDRQYSTDISKNNIFNSFINYDDQSRDYSNYREFNKSVSVSRAKNKINIPIYKRYEEDNFKKENKSYNENIVNNIKIQN